MREPEKTCPECGVGKLIFRSGKFGDFYGCSNYPDCDYTCNVEELEKDDDTRGEAV